MTFYFSMFSYMHWNNYLHSNIIWCMFSIFFSWIYYRILSSLFLINLISMFLLSYSFISYPYSITYPKLLPIYFYNPLPYSDILIFNTLSIYSEHNLGNYILCFVRVNKYMLNYLYDSVINNYLNVLSNSFTSSFYFFSLTKSYTNKLNTGFIPSYPFCLNLAVSNSTFLLYLSNIYILALYSSYTILTAYTWPNLAAVISGVYL